MRQRLQWTCVVALAIQFTQRPARAESPTNSLVTPLQESDACVRRLREGYEFFKTMSQRRDDLQTSRAARAIVPAA